MEYEKLYSMHDRFLSDERMYLEKVRDPSKIRFYLNGLESVNVSLALHAIHVLDDANKAREHFYKAALAGEYIVRNYDQLLHTGIYKICYALLSDNSELIKNYSNLKNKNWNENFIGYQFNASIQAILRGDNKELKKLIALLNKSIQKKGNISYKGLINVFKGIKNNNRELVEDGLNSLLSTHKRRDKYGLTKEYISFEATALAKLAIIKGIEVTVDNKLTPKKLLPIQELNEYSTYDFFTNEKIKILEVHQSDNDSISKNTIDFKEISQFLEALQIASGQTYGKNKLRELLTKLDQEKKLIIENEGSLITISSKDDLQKLINSYDPNIMLSQIV